MKRIVKLLIMIFIFCVTLNVNARSYTEEEYKELNIRRAYVVCNYLFDVGEYNPTLKDYLLAAQSCPNNNVSLYQITVLDNGLRTLNLLTSQSTEFPVLDIRFIEKGSIESKSNEMVVDSTPNTNTYELEKINLDNATYKSLNLQRSYVVGSYIFDINSYNPTLQDLMLANQTAEKGTATLYQIKIAPSLDDSSVAESYQEILSSSEKVNGFPSGLQERYVYYDKVIPSQPDSEAKIDLLNNHPGDVSGIKLSDTKVSLQLNEEKQVTAEALPTGVENSNFTWISNNQDIATVSNGLIKAKTGGTTTITVRSNTGVEVTIEVEVIDNNPKATIICEDKTYNGTPQQIAVCSGGTVANNVQTNGGIYQITCTGDENHQDAAPENCKVLRTDTTTSLTSKSEVYSGDVIPMTGASSILNSTGEAITDATYTYKYYSDPLCTIGETTNAPVDAGTYYVKAVLTLHEDYNSSESSCIEFNIEQLDNTFTVDPQERAYTGYGLDAVAIMTYSKTVEENLKVNFTYYTDDTCSTLVPLDKTANAIPGTAPKAAGDYYVIGVSEGNKNYRSYTSDCEAITTSGVPAVKINKVSAICPDNIVPYNNNYVEGKWNTFTIEGDTSVSALGGTLKFCAVDPDDDTYCSDPNNWTTEQPKRMNGGETVVNVKVFGDESHTDISCGSTSINVIKPANTIVITPYDEDVYYTSNRIEAQVSAFEDDEFDILSGVTYYTDVNCETVAEPINVGTYYVQVVTPETTNYASTDTSTHDATSCREGLTIKPTPTTTTLEDIERTYDGTNQEVSSATSKFNSNDMNIAESTNANDLPVEYKYYYYNGLDCDPENVISEYAPVNAGTYSVKAQLDVTYKHNYLSSEACAKYTMNKGTDSIVIDEQTASYDNSNPSGAGVYAEPKRSTQGYLITYTYYTDPGCREGTEVEKPFNVGTYYVKATTKDDPTNINYETVYKECTRAVIITPVDTIITCRDNVENGTHYNLKYNNDSQVIAECNGGTFVDSNDRTIEKEDAGTYLLTCINDENHETTSAYCTIDPADTVTKVNGNDANLLNRITRDYQSGMRQGVNKETDHIVSNLENKPDVTFTGDYNYEYYSEEGCTGTLLDSVPIDAGNYSVKVILVGTSNYKTSNTCVPFTINKINSTITVNYRDNIAYTGNEVTASATSTSNSNITFKYYVDDICYTETTTNDNGALTVGGAPKYAGTYYVRATSAATDNYLETTTDCIKALSIKAAYATCPEITAYSGTYDGKPHTITIGDTTNIGGTLKYKDDDQLYGTNGEWVVDPPTRTVVGTSTIQIKVEGDITHLTQTCDSKDVVITKKLDVVTINPDTVEPHVVNVKYDGNYHYATASAESGTNIVITYYSDSTCSTPIVGAPIKVGTYYARATSTGNDNYDSNSVCAKAVVITPEQAKCPTDIRGVNTPYNNGNPYSIFVSNDYEGGRIEFKTTSGSWTETNPVITSVSQSTQVSVRVHNTDGNYEDAQCGTYDLVLTKINPEITCTNPTYTGSSLNIATCVGGTIGNNNQTNAGTYTVTCTGDSNHLDITSSNGVKCGINKSNTTTTLPPQNKNYNGSAQEATGATSKLSSTNTTINGTTYTYAYYSDTECTATITTPVYGGTYYVQATLVPTGNYNTSQSSCVKYIMTQNKEPATITCNSNLVYNGEEQEIATCTGGTIYANTRKDAGEYTVICTGDEEHVDSTATCSIAKANSTCPAVSSTTGPWPPESYVYLEGNPVATGGTAWYKLSRCQTENYSTNPNGNTECVPEWTPNFYQTGVNTQGTTSISVKVEGNNNYNGIENCGTYTITLE